MTKRYRLKIKYPIMESELSTAYQLQSQDGLEIAVIVHGESGFRVQRTVDTAEYIVPKRWLEEIVEEPVSVEKIADSCVPLYFHNADKDQPVYGRKTLVQAIKLSEKNSDLRHIESVTMEESRRKRNFEWGREDTGYTAGWQDCEKSHNWKPKDTNDL